VWWDPQLFHQIARARGRISAYQVCDFLLPIPEDALLARGMPGDGHIDFEHWTRVVAAAGYAGDVEVEIFNAAIWARDPEDVVREMVERYEALVAPYL
jgi:sugar phosphate isomerase/epimerase